MNSFQLSKKILILAILLCVKPIFAQQTDATIQSKVEDILNKLTLEEKINLLHGTSSFTSGGVSRLGISELVMSDGPHGVRPEHGRDWKLDNAGNDSSTYLPVGLCLASTWNPELGYKFGSVLGAEAKNRGKDIILGPGVNIIRSPLNGRNFEYMSEDPFLTSKMAVGYIKGVQDQGIAACVKHFAANNQETNRDGINVLMTERTLQEIYLPAFKAAVTEGNVYSIMGAYNKLRGQYCSYNQYLINDLLKKQWNFKGIVISDWGAIHTSKDALLGGTDIEMGSDIGKPAKKYDEFYLADSALKLVQSGEVSVEVVNEKVRRILWLMLKTNKIDAVQKSIAISSKQHATIAKQIADESIILLKNKNQILPISKSNISSLALIGANTKRPNAMGGGSSQVRPKYEITPFDGLKDLVGESIKLNYCEGYKIERNAKANQTLINDAVEAAKKSDMAIVFGGWVHGFNYYKWSDNYYDAEGVDKPDLQMPFGQDELIAAVIDANPNTIVVLFGAGSLDISKWESKAKAIVQVGYPGQEGGKAIAEMLFGDINPSGKLTYTWPKKLEDTPAIKLNKSSDNNMEVKYEEGIFIGYRYYDTYQIKPQFAFGHGLSYTNFKLSELKIDKIDNHFYCTVNVSNTGNFAGSEVVQLYVGKQNSVASRPTKELKGFEKIFIQAGETKTTTIKLDLEAFMYYNDTLNKWVLEPGKYQILVGNSSDQISYKKTIRF